MYFFCAFIRCKVSHFKYYIFFIDWSKACYFEKSIKQYCGRTSIHKLSFYNTCSSLHAYKNLCFQVTALGLTSHRKVFPRKTLLQKIKSLNPKSYSFTAVMKLIKWLWLHFWGNYDTVYPQTVSVFLEQVEYQQNHFLS